MSHVTDQEQFIVAMPKYNLASFCEMQKEYEEDTPHVMVWKEALRFYNWLYKTGKADEGNPATIIRLNPIVPYAIGIVENEQELLDKMYTDDAAKGNLEQCKIESEARMKLIKRVQGALSVFDELAQEKRQGM